MSLQINPVRLPQTSQSQNKPAFGAKALICTQYRERMVEEIGKILSEKTKSSNDHFCSHVCQNGVALFGSDAKLATIILTLAERNRLTTDVSASLKKLLTSGGDKFADFCEKVK